MSASSLQNSASLVFEMEDPEISCSGATVIGTVVTLIALGSLACLTIGLLNHFGIHHFAGLNATAQWSLIGGGFFILTSMILGGYAAIRVIRSRN